LDLRLHIDPTAVFYLLFAAVTMVQVRSVVGTHTLLRRYIPKTYGHTVTHVHTYISMQTVKPTYNIHTQACSPGPQAPHSNNSSVPPLPQYHEEWGSPDNDGSPTRDQAEGSLRLGGQARTAKALQVGNELRFAFPLISGLLQVVCWQAGVWTSALHL
jgi:hypothetical protein